MFVKEQPLTYLERSRAERQLLREAWLLLALYRFCMLVIPWRFVQATIGKQGEQTSEQIEAEHEPFVLQIAEIIESARWATPWNSNCMARALAGQHMLRRRNIPSTLYIGVFMRCKLKEKNPETHAWLRAGQHIVTGGDGSKHCKILTSFAMFSSENR